MQKKKLVLGGGIAILLFLLIVWGVIATNVNSENEAELKAKIVHRSTTSSIPPDLLAKLSLYAKGEDKFPYYEVAKEVGIANLSKLTLMLEELEKSLPNNSSKYQQDVFYALSDTIIKLEMVNLQSLASINDIILRSTAYHHASQMDKGNEILFEVLFNFWMSAALSATDEIVSQNYWQKYGVDYRVIKKVSSTYNYHSSVGYNDVEKIILNVGDSKYGYIYYKFIVRTSLLQKFVLTIFSFFFLIISLYGLYAIVQKIKKIRHG